MIPKVAVLYEEPDLDWHHLQFTCAGCIFFIHDVNQCELLNPENVTDNQGCGLYVGGQPTDSIHAKPLKLIHPNVAGLADGPFTCKRCRFLNWTGISGGRAPCEFGVADFQGDTVSINGCCNAWSEPEE